MSKKNSNCLTRAQGMALVASFYKSGLKQKDYCLQNNIAYHILQYWKPIYHKLSMTKPEVAKFVPLTVATKVAKCMDDMSPIKILLSSGFTVEVKAGVDASMLKMVIEVCSACG